MIAEYKWKKLIYRVYHWADGSQMEFRNLCSLRIAVTGCHTLKDNKGTLFIVASGWRWIDQSSEEQNDL